MNKRVEHWIRTFAFFEPIIDEYGEKHPEHMDKVREYKNVVVEIFNHDKQGLIQESAGDKIRRMTENAKPRDWRVEQDICDDYFSTEPSC